LEYPKPSTAPTTSSAVGLRTAVLSTSAKTTARAIKEAEEKDKSAGAEPSASASSNAKAKTFTEKDGDSMQVFCQCDGCLCSAHYNVLIIYRATKHLDVVADAVCF